VSTVYLIAQPSLDREGRAPDLSSLRAHGELRVVVRSGEYPSSNPQRAMRLVRERMADFNPSTDFVVWAGGDTLAALLVGVVLAEKGCYDVMWLRYDRPRDPNNSHRRTHTGARYVPLVVPLQETLHDVAL
jgi:hypothetical protein